MTTIFKRGTNCIKTARADRVALLVDAEDYFRAFVQAAQLATRSIIILAWDFDSRTQLCFSEDKKLNLTLGAFLNKLAQQKPHLHVHVLDWDYPMIFGTDRELPPTYGFGWKPRRRVHFRFDNTHPVAGSHHQKIVVIDDVVAFSGGLDLTSRRWDTCEHRAGDKRRITSVGDPYPPFHDAMALVDGEAALGLAEIARERWYNATGETLHRAHVKSDRWPAALKPDLVGVTVGLSRTMPPVETQSPVREIEALYLDMIARARSYMYIENQYLTAHRLGEAMAARLQERAGPEIVIVQRLLSHGWLEEATMHTLRAQLIAKLRAADRWHRFGIYYPHVPGLTDGTCVDVHSKLMIVDDEWLRIGSANLCNRSMGMDTECDLTFEARGKAATVIAIRDFRNRLLAEHLAVDAEKVQAEYARTGSLNSTIDALKSADRTLQPLEHLKDASEAVVSMAALADPEQPVSLDLLVKQFAPRERASRRPAISLGIAAFVVLVCAGLTAVWKFTPLAQLATPDQVIGWAQDFGDLWWAPLIVLAAYTPACLIFFPRPLITFFAVLAFGAWLGFAYAMSGILIAALIMYLGGRVLKAPTVRRLAGDKLNRVSEILCRRGLVAMSAVRLVPVAPFFVVGIVAGAIRLKLRDYIPGTAIGLLPGTLAATIFGDHLQTVLQNPSAFNYWLVAGVIVVFGSAVIIMRRWLKAQLKSANGSTKKDTAFA